MGIPGYVIVTIKTEINPDESTVVKTIQYHGGVGLNALSFDFDFYKPDQNDSYNDYLKNRLFRDLSMLPDGKYRLVKKKRPDNFLHFDPDPMFDYVWAPGEKDEFE